MTDNKKKGLTSITAEEIDRIAAQIEQNGDINVVELEKLRKIVMDAGRLDFENRVKEQQRQSDSLGSTTTTYKGGGSNGTSGDTGRCVVT
jgi:hypothetical protein